LLARSFITAIFFAMIGVAAVFVATVFVPAVFVPAKLLAPIFGEKLAARLVAGMIVT